MTRTDLKAYCFELVTKDRSYFLSCKNDEELYSWMHEIYSRSPLMGVSNPTNFVHKVHVGFDPNTGNFTVGCCSLLPSIQSHEMASLLTHRLWFSNLFCRACQRHGPSY